MSAHSHLPLVQQLLQAEAAAERRARWEACDAQSLELEIAKYKQALAGVLDELNRLGERRRRHRRCRLSPPATFAAASAPPPTCAASVTSPHPTTGPGSAGDADEDGAQEGQEGVEGVDWRYGSVDDLDCAEWQVPPHCIPIHANVTTYDWSRLVASTQFDVIMMDPPWQLATANPTRGVALGYSQVSRGGSRSVRAPGRGLATPLHACAVPLHLLLCAVSDPTSAGAASHYQINPACARLCCCS